MTEDIFTEPLESATKTPKRRTKRRKAKVKRSAGILANLNHERMVQAYLKGGTQVEAYISCGLNAKDPEKAAYAIFGRAEVKARLRELRLRVENRVVTNVVKTTTINREFIMRELAENLERAKQVKGGSNIVNRAAELLGKAIGMFHENAPPEPKTIEDLPTSVLESILANSTNKEPVQ